MKHKGYKIKNGKQLYRLLVKNQRESIQTVGKKKNKTFTKNEFIQNCTES